VPKVSLSLEEYLALVDAARRTTELVADARAEAVSVVADVKKVKRKTSAYNRRYKAAFKKVAKKYKLKSGKWKKNGFKAAVKAAHKMAGGKK